MVCNTSDWPTLACLIASIMRSTNPRSISPVGTFSFTSMERPLPSSAVSGAGGEIFTTTAGDVSTTGGAAIATALTVSGFGIGGVGITVSLGGAGTGLYTTIGGAGFTVSLGGAGVAATGLGLTVSTGIFITGGIT